MLAWPVSSRVNTAKADDETLTHPVEPPPDEQQQLL
jgi:hypothetical protein